MQVEQRHRDAVDCWYDQTTADLAPKEIGEMYQMLARFEASLPSSAPVDQTPAAEWREKGKPDPHGDWYNHDRARLCGGHLTDDQVAFEIAMLGRHDLNHEAVVQTAKDRIRWLSRKLVEALATPSVLAESTSNDCLLVAEGWQDEVGEDAREALAWADRSVEYQFGGYAFTQSFQPNAEHIATLARLASATLSRTPAVTDLSGVGAG